MASALVESKLHTGALLAASLISLFFTASIISPGLQRLISNPVFMFLGFVSYPLYLLHENMMVSIVVKLGGQIDFMPSYLFPLIALILISTLSYYISKYVEPAFKKQLITGIDRVQLLIKRQAKG